MEDEEDYGALIYRESQLRKAEAATAAAAKDAKKKKSSTTTSIWGRIEVVVQQLQLGQHPLVPGVILCGVTAENNYEEV